jgi:hypothetical protein
MSEISVGLAHEFFLTALKAGFSPSDFSKLTQDEKKLRELLPVVRGYKDAVLRPLDADVQPKDIEKILGGDLSLVSHKKNGVFLWDDKKVRLIQLTGQKRRDILDVKGVSWANATVLEYLVNFRDLIPELWNKISMEFSLGPYFIFPGTIYRHKSRELGLGCPLFNPRIGGADIISIERVEPEVQLWEDRHFFVVLE